MRTGLIACLSMLVFSPAVGLGQASGNAAFSQASAKARAELSQQKMRTLTKDEQPPTATSTFVEASVLMNVKADEYIAVFGIVQEGATVAECNDKMAATVKGFSDAIAPLGIRPNDVFVDFVAQHKIYGFEVQGEVAREKLVGFELKKNVSIHYQDAAVLDKLVVTAAGAQIFDLIKVDYIVKDTGRIQDRLMDEAARLVKQKAARYEKLLGIKLQPPAQIFTERMGIHYPTELYDSYAAFESDTINSNFNRQRYAIQTARKSRTFFWNGLDADGFDSVINPVAIEPVVQFTQYLKVKYEVEQIPAR